MRHTRGDLASCLKGRRRQAEREVSRGHSRCGMTEGPNLSRVVSHAYSLRVLGRSSDESREPAINTGRTSSPEGDPGVHRTTGDTTNETSSLLCHPHGWSGRQEPPYAEPHVRWCGRGPEDSGSLPDACRGRAICLTSAYLCRHCRTRRLGIG